MSTKFKNFTLIVGLLIFLAGVGLFAYLGYYNRYWADDWCYNADFKNMGFIETVRGYSYNTTYTPSRYSVTIFAGLIQAFETLGMQLMSPLTIIFWVTGLIFLFYNITRMVGYHGYLSPLSPQRQSGGRGSSNHTDTPNAPAR